MFGKQIRPEICPECDVETLYKWASGRKAYCMNCGFGLEEKLRNDVYGDKIKK